MSCQLSLLGTRPFFLPARTIRCACFFRQGHRVCAKKIRPWLGDALDHSSDQQAKVITLAIRRGTEEISLPDTVQFFCESSFSSYWGISYADAVRRVNAIVGIERVKVPVRVGTLDLEIEALPEHSESKRGNGVGFCDSRPSRHEGGKSRCLITRTKDAKKR